MATAQHTARPSSAESALARTLRLLAVPPRPQILTLLRGGDRTTAELATTLGLSTAQISRHLRALRRTGLVLTTDGDGRGRRHHLDWQVAASVHTGLSQLVDPSRLPLAMIGNFSSSPDAPDRHPLPAPPPEACQNCRNTYYVHGLLASIQKQLDESREYQKQLRLMSSQVLTAQEEERKRLARDLHDDTGQALTSLLVQLRLLERAAGKPELRERLTGLRDQVVTTLESVRRLALDLRPSALDDLGLIPTLQQHVASFGEARGLKTGFSASGINRRLPIDLELVLYRVAQEALNNIAKHASAHRATVTLERVGLRVRLVVEDDGTGFDIHEAMTSKDRGLGLFGMRERLALMGGSLHLDSRQGEGTRIVAEIPLPHPPPTIGG